MEPKDRLLFGLGPGWSQLAKFKEFIETAPLYKQLKIELPEGFHLMIPETLRLYCRNCKDLRTFRDYGTKDHSEVKRDLQNYEQYIGRKSEASLAGGLGLSGIFKPRPWGIYRMIYLCSDCERQRFYCWVEILSKDPMALSSDALWKVGQVPPWMASIPKEIEKELGKDAELYKKALNCISVSHGIGACAYLRRVLENHINPLLELLYAKKQEEKASDTELETIRKTIEGKDFTSKTKLAYEIAPSSIIVDGMNPLYELHQAFSSSLHVRDDDEALDIALRLYKNLEFVIRHLRREIDERKEYTKAMKEMQKQKAKKE